MGRITQLFYGGFYRLSHSLCANQVLTRAMGISHWAWLIRRTRTCKAIGSSFFSGWRLKMAPCIMDSAISPRAIGKHCNPVAFQMGSWFVRDSGSPAACHVHGINGNCQDILLNFFPLSQILLSSRFISRDKKVGVVYVVLFFTQTL